MSRLREGLRNWLILFWPTCNARDGLARCPRRRWHAGKHRTYGHHRW